MKELSAIPGIEAEVAQLLVKSGFHSFEGLLTVDVADLAEIVGADKADAVSKAAIAEQEHREAATGGEPTPE